MATIKSFTSIEQSRKLSEILPLESADNHYWRNGYNNYICGLGNYVELKEKFEEKGLKYLPCWSLAALLNVLPNSIYDNTNEYSQLEFSKRSVVYHDINDGIKVGSIKDNLVDACYELILKLNKLNLL